MPAYKHKPFPAPLDAPRLRGLTQSCAFILAANWCMQGMRGMDRKELASRLGLEALAAVLLLGLLPASPLALLAALVLAHSLSFTLNGQVWVCARYCRWFRASPARTTAFLARIARDLRSRAWLDEAVIIGSRGGGAGLGPRSDIDLRLITPPGLLGWLRTSLWLLRWRALAFWQIVPLDLYAYDRPGSLARFDQDEPLRIILDRKGRLAAAFPGRVVR